MIVKRLFNKDNRKTVEKIEQNIYPNKSNIVRYVNAVKAINYSKVNQLYFKQGRKLPKLFELWQIKSKKIVERILNKHRNKIFLILNI